MLRRDMVVGFLHDARLRRGRDIVRDCPIHAIESVTQIGLNLHAKIPYFKRQRSRARHEDDVWKFPSRKAGVFNDDTGS